MLLTLQAARQVDSVLEACSSSTELVDAGFNAGGALPEAELEYTTSIIVKLYSTACLSLISSRRRDQGKEWFRNRRERGSRDGT